MSIENIYQISTIVSIHIGTFGIYTNTEVKRKSEGKENMKSESKGFKRLKPYGSPSRRLVCSCRMRIDDEKLYCIATQSHPKKKVRLP